MDGGLHPSLKVLTSKSEHLPRASPLGQVPPEQPVAWLLSLCSDPTPALKGRRPNPTCTHAEPAWVGFYPAGDFLSKHLYILHLVCRKSGTFSLCFSLAVMGGLTLGTAARNTGLSSTHPFQPPTKALSWKKPRVRQWTSAKH